MYWLRIVPLKRELAGPGLTERQRFAYVLVTALASALAALAQEGAADVRVYVARAIVVVLTFLTVWNAYRCNGGRHGSAFLDRFFSLGWVVSVRTGLVVLLAQHAVPALLGLAGITGGDDDAEPSRLSLGLSLLGGAWIAWSLGRHIRDVAAAASLPAGTAAQGAQRLERFVESVALREAGGGVPIAAGAATRRPRRSAVTVVRRRKRA
jgi:hypothetical protein